jgi:hypothetical protein
VGPAPPLLRGNFARPGDNLFSCSTLAIDVSSGQIVWHYQNTPHDGWDFDGVNEFVTFDMDGHRDGTQHVAVVSGWGGAVPLWGGDVAKKVNYLNQGGSVWVFKLFKPQMAEAASH